jgi:hypothetical protein
MSFPPKVFLFNHMAQYLYPMVNPQEQSIIFPRPGFHDALAGTVMDTTLGCKVNTAFAITGFELIFPKDAQGYFLDQGTVSLIIDSEWVVAKRPLREYAEGPVPFTFREKSDLFRIVPFSTWPKEPLTYSGLFLTNGTRLEVFLKGLPEGMKVRPVLHAALYEVTGGPYQHPLGPREWSPRMKACI